ncbi:MAG: HAMP domain-containing protein [Amphiplicatus sp.]
MGGSRVSTRLRWFVVLSVSAFAVLGGLYYHAEKTMAEAARLGADAAALHQRALEIEKNIWHLRSTEKDFILSGDPRFIGVYDSLGKSLSGALSALESLSASKAIKEHIATVNDGVAQHAAAFQELIKGRNADSGDQVEEHAKKLETSARALESQLNRANIASLKDSFSDIRKAEIRFKSTGAAADLLANKKQSEAFDRLLASAALPDKDRTTLRRLMEAYQADMTSLAKATLSQAARASRLDEIFAYLLPSLNGITEFAAKHRLAAREDTERLERTARAAAVAGGAGVILLLLTGGLILMQSLAAPIRDMAEQADKLVYGEQNVVLPALGNRDEIGEVARALNILRDTLAELSGMTGELKRTRDALEAAQRDAQEARVMAQNLETQTRDFERRAQEAEETVAQAEAKLQAQDDIRARVQAQVQAQANAQTQAMQRQARETEAKLKAAEAKTRTLEAQAEDAEAKARSAQEQARAAQDQMRAAQARAADAQNKAAAAERALAEAQKRIAERPADTSTNQAADRSADQSAAPVPAADKSMALAVVQNAETPIDAIASLSQYLAQSSRNVSDAAFEAERTSALIRGLNDAESQLEKIDPLIRLIGKQTDFLATTASRPQTKPNDPHGNLAALSAQQGSPDNRLGLGDADIRNRFETVRKAAVQILQSVRTVAQSVARSKGSALEIAAASSADALAITNDLLEQSEHLRGMLNDLIGTRHSTSLPAPQTAAKAAPKTAPKSDAPKPERKTGHAPARKPAPKLSAQAVKKPAPPKPAGVQKPERKNPVRKPPQK